MNNDKHRYRMLLSKPFNTYKKMRVDRSSILVVGILLIVGCGNSGQQRVDHTYPVIKNEKEANGSLVAELAGRWFDELHDGDTKFFEQWQQQEDGNYEGIGFVMSGPDTVFIENLKLTKNNGIWVYNARISSQNQGEWIEFQQGHADDSELLFENTAHDFPQSIRYTLDQGRWNVTVEGEENGAKRVENFRLARRTDTQ